MTWAAHPPKPHDTRDVLPGIKEVSPTGNDTARPKARAIRIDLSRDRDRKPAMSGVIADAMIISRTPCVEAPAIAAT